MVQGHTYLDGSYVGFASHGRYLYIVAHADLAENKGSDIPEGDKENLFAQFPPRPGLPAEFRAAILSQELDICIQGALV